MELSVIILIVFIIFTLSEKKSLRFLFHYTPPVIYIYFIPMLFSTIGILPHKHSSFTFIENTFLPGAVLLLIATSDLNQIKKLGFRPFLTMIIATLSVLAGAILTWFIFSGILEKDAWKGFTALSASWIGGSTNMLAAGKSIDTPANLFGIMIIVDTIAGYGWLAFLIFLSPFSRKIDKMNKVSTGYYETRISAGENTIMQKNENPEGEKESKHFSIKNAALVAILIIVIPEILTFLGKITPIRGKIVSAFGWTIIYATAAGIGLSFLKPIKEEKTFYQSTGNFLLYLVLGVIGASSDFTAIFDSPVYLLAGIVWITIHGILLFLIAGRLFKISFPLIAVSSQCNIGGIVSGPILASVYHPSLVPSALILAVLGNLYGLYAAFLLGWILS